MSRGQPGAPSAHLDATHLDAADLNAESAERVVAEAWHRVLDLVDRLAAHPIDAATYRELRAYLAADADVAVAAYEKVTADGVAALLERVDELNQGRPDLAVVEGGAGSEGGG